MKRVIFVSVILALQAAAGVCAAPVVRHVPAEYASIQQAIQDSNDGDVVIVSPGLYVELINFSGKNIIVTSEDPNDPEVVRDTIINGDDDGTVVTFENGETSKAVLTGFTIAGGYGTASTVVPEDGLVWGAGIYCANASPTITKNIIANNHGPMATDAQGNPTVYCYGGGLGLIASNAIVTNNIIRNNSAAAGGAMMTYTGNPKIANNLIYSNSGAIGGGIVLFGGELRNNTIVNNDHNVTSPFGISYAGNLYAAAFDEGDEVAQSVVVNNIIVKASAGGGVFLTGTWTASAFRFNNVWGNFPGNYVGVNSMTGELTYDGALDKTGSSGNIRENPLFVKPDDNDYHLTIDSLCVNAADPAYVPPIGETDIDGEPRIYAVWMDIGADEYVGYVKPIAYAGDDQHVAGLELVTLDGSGSFFYDPCSPRMFSWTQVGGPAVNPNDPNNTQFVRVQLSDPSAVKPSFVPPQLGYYRFELIVSDGTATSRPDKMLVIVGNQRPIADAGADRVTSVPAVVTLDGTGSLDSDPTDKLTYKWKQLEGPQVTLLNANSPTPSFDCNQAGNYVFELVVNDGFEDSLPSTVKVITVAVTTSQQSADVGLGGVDYYHYPAISDSKIVYAVGPSWHYTWDIKVKDLLANKTYTLTGGGIDTQPKIDGDIVVWAGGPPSPSPSGLENTSIFIRNLSTGKQSTLRFYSMNQSFSHPAISANKVVWLQHLGIDRDNPDQWSNTSYDICGADISNFDKPVFFTIAQNVGSRDPFPVETYSEDFDDVIDISGNLVVWEANGDIYGADISDLSNIKVFSICTQAARQYDPAISGTTVVWTDERNDGGDIYGAEISELHDVREFEVAKAPRNQIQPDIDGCIVTYIEGSNYGGTIQACCLTKQYGALQIHFDGYLFGVRPTIDGDLLAWQLSTYSDPEGIWLEFGYAAPDGPVTNLNTGATYDYIQHAIYAANEGEHIVAQKGIYGENLTLKGKNIRLTSEVPGDPEVVAQTVISANGRIITFGEGVDANSLLAGFTITGGQTGIYCFTASPRIENCDISGNSSNGIDLNKDSNARIDNCRITNNGGSGILSAVLMKGRDTFYNYPTITDCLIASNKLHGISGSAPTVINCTIVANEGIGFYSNMRKISTITNSIVYYNGQVPNAQQILSNYVSVTYSDIQGSFPGQGNIDADPRFVELGHWTDVQEGNASAPVWVPGDYHLLMGSACIDAGDANAVQNQTDIDGNPRIAGRSVDMGAFEAQTQPRIELSQSRFRFDATVGSAEPEDQLLLIQNAGMGELNWEITYPPAECNWLEVKPTSGGQSDVVWLKVKPQDIAAGTHTCELTITSPSAINSPRTVTVELVVRKNCFPDTPQFAQQYSDFMAYIAHGADPRCWCAQPVGSGYQCDGDADGKTQEFTSHRIFTNDLAKIIKNWRKKVHDADPCADIDHKANAASGFRVFTGDLAVLVNNWKKTDNDLPGNCPRADGQ